MTKKWILISWDLDLLRFEKQKIFLSKLGYRCFRGAYQKRQCKVLSLKADQTARVFFVISNWHGTFFLKMPSVVYNVIVAQYFIFIISIAFLLFLYKIFIRLSVISETTMEFHITAVKLMNVFLSISFNMCFGCSRQQIQPDSSFEYLQHVLVGQIIF